MKKTAIILSMLLFCFSLSPTAYAHPGRTDANGGHYNRSTGEYHYHNGGSSNSKPSSGSTSTNNTSPTVRPTSTPTETPTKSPTSTPTKTPTASPKATVTPKATRASSAASEEISNGSKFIGFMLFLGLIALVVYLCRKYKKSK